MERPATTAEKSALPTWAWLLGVLALLTWQGWLTLSLFGDDPWENLRNDQPIVSGMHPQKQYIGELGSNGLVRYGRTLVFDHRFQIGWPKTPIFDGSFNSVASDGTDLPNGLVIKAAGLTVENSVFSGDAIDSRPFSTVATQTGLHISHNLFSGWNEGAYLVNGSTGTVDHNTFVNDGNGIVTSQSAAAPT